MTARAGQTAPNSSGIFSRRAVCGRSVGSGVVVRAGQRLGASLCRTIACRFIHFLCTLVVPALFSLITPGSLCLAHPPSLPPPPIPAPPSLRAGTLSTAYLSSSPSIRVPPEYANNDDVDADADAAATAAPRYRGSIASRSVCRINWFPCLLAPKNAIGISSLLKKYALPWAFVVATDRSLTSSTTTTTTELSRSWSF